MTSLEFWMVKDRVSWPRVLLSRWGTAGKGSGEESHPGAALPDGPTGQATFLLDQNTSEHGWKGEAGVHRGQPVPGVNVLPKEAHPA